MATEPRVGDSVCVQCGSALRMGTDGVIRCAERCEPYARYESVYLGGGMFIRRALPVAFRDTSVQSLDELLYGD